MLMPFGLRQLGFSQWSAVSLAVAGRCRRASVGIVSWLCGFSIHQEASSGFLIQQESQGSKEHEEKVNSNAQALFMSLLLTHLLRFH